MTTAVGLAAQNLMFERLDGFDYRLYAVQTAGEFLRIKSAEPRLLNVSGKQIKKKFASPFRYSTSLFSVSTTQQKKRRKKNKNKKQGKNDKKKNHKQKKKKKKKNRRKKERKISTLFVSPQSSFLLFFSS